MKIYFLYTDILIWLLFISLVVWGVVALRSEMAREKMSAVFGSRVAFVSAVVLGFYLFFALADSVHMRTKDGIFSLLDMSMMHAIKHKERTYSAPFATKEFVKSITKQSNSKVLQRYRELRYVKKGTFWVQTIKGLFWGISISLAMVLLEIFIRAKDGFVARLKMILSKRSKVPYVTGYISFILLFSLFSWIYTMSFDYHVFGTDKVGGDVLYATIKSIRTGVLIGTLTTLITLPIAIFLGVSAGYFGGKIDDIIQYLYTTLSSIPGVLLIAAGVLMMQVAMQNHASAFSSSMQRSDLRLLFLVFILGITSWTSLCRMIRAESMRISQIDFVTAAKVFGVSDLKIMFRHIVPNLSHIIVISIVLDFSSLVLVEAVLSYVGVGVDPTMYSWGNMINSSRVEMARDPMVWWSLFASFLFMFILVLAANLFSDRVQKVLDPRSSL